METFHFINQIPKINMAHWNLPWMSCILKFRALKISLETLERSFHRGEKTEINREASWDIWNSPFGLSVWFIFSFLALFKVAEHDAFFIKFVLKLSLLLHHQIKYFFFSLEKRFYSGFTAVLDNTRPALSLDIVFFCDVNRNLKARRLLSGPLRKQKFIL